MSRAGAGPATRPFRVRLSGREPISHPLAPVLVDLGARLARRGLAPPGAGALAVRAGRPMLTTADETTLGELTTADLVEVADYDPLERLLLAVGPREPNEAAPVLWLILRHREEVGALILVPEPQPLLAEDSKDAGIAVAAATGSQDPLDIAKTCLRALRDAPVVHCRGLGLLATGPGIPGTERHLLQALARSHPERFAGDAWAAPPDQAPTRKRNGGSGVAK